MFAPLKTETIQALLDEARYLDTKPKEEHDMKAWSCGTVSCAAGDMAIIGACGLFLAWKPGHGKQPSFAGSMVWMGMDAMERALDISNAEARYLFSCDFGVGQYGVDGYRCYRYRKRETPHQTAARIRKYLYYRMRKAEILADYENARRQEGDWNVCQGAIEFADARG